jgi:hypothetical protein
LSCLLACLVLSAAVSCLLLCLWPHHPLMFSQISLWVGVSVSAHTHPHRYFRNDERVVGPCLVFGFVFTCLVLSWRVVFSLVLSRYIL